MRKLFIGLMASAALLSACQSAEEKAAQTEAELAALSVCPADKIVDLTAYTTDGFPDPSLDIEAWLAKNAERDGVTTTASGLQYSVVQSGDPRGPSPEGGQTIKVNYHGIFPDGETFDSSYNRGEPIEFPANRVIQGWIEGLGLMKPCDAWTLYVPGDLAYGPRGRPGIPANATLLFHVQLLAVK